MKQDYKAKKRWQLDDTDYPDYQPTSKTKNFPLPIAISGIVIVLLAAASIWGYQHYRNIQKPAVIAKQQTKQPKTVTIALQLPNHSSGDTQNADQNS